MMLVDSMPNNKNVDTSFVFILKFLKIFSAIENLAYLTTNIIAVNIKPKKAVNILNVFWFLNIVHIVEGQTLAIKYT